MLTDRAAYDVVVYVSTSLRTPADTPPVPRSSVISVRFDDDGYLNQILAGSAQFQSRNPQSLAQLLRVYASDGRAVEGSVSRNGATAIFTPIAALKSNEKYTVRVRMPHARVHDLGSC